MDIVSRAPVVTSRPTVIQQSSAIPQRSELRSKLVAALIAAGVSTFASNAYAEEALTEAIPSPEVPVTIGAPKAEEKTTHAAEAAEEKESILKAGMYVGMDSTNSVGGEIAYSWRPLKNGLIVTPANLGFYSFYAEEPGNKQVGQKNLTYQPKFFAGSLIGFGQPLFGGIEAEVGLGGGLVLKPEGQETVAKAEVQITIPYTFTPVLGGAVEIPAGTAQKKKIPESGVFIGGGWRF